MSPPVRRVPSQAAAPADSNSRPSTATVIAAAAGAALGAAFVRTLPPTGAVHLLGGALMGALVGLVPFLMGKRRDQERLGKQAMGWCTVGGMAFGLLLAGPIALGYVVAIRRRSA